MAKYNTTEAIATVKEWFSPENINQHELGVLDRIGFVIWRMSQNPAPIEQTTQLFMLGCTMAAFQLGKGAPVPDAFFEAIASLDMADFENNSEEVMEQINSLFKDTGW
jgi:hypothetical protein